MLSLILLVRLLSLSWVIDCVVLLIVINHYRVSKTQLTCSRCEYEFVTGAKDTFSILTILTTEGCSPLFRTRASPHLLNCLRLVHVEGFLLVIALGEVLVEQVVLLRHGLPRGENCEQAGVLMPGYPPRVFQFQTEETAFE